MNTRQEARQRGQGLVEYALILVLVAVVVIAVLTLLGPQVGNVFSRVNAGLGVATGGGGGGGAVVINASADIRTNSNVTVNVSVSENTTITLEDQVGGATKTVTCNGVCSPTFDLGHTGGGTITITAPGGTYDVIYGPVT